MYRVIAPFLWPPHKLWLDQGIFVWQSSDSRIQRHKIMSSFAVMLHTCLAPSLSTFSWYRMLPNVWNKQALIMCTPNGSINTARSLSGWNGTDHAKVPLRDEWLPGCLSNRRSPLERDSDGPYGGGNHFRWLDSLQHSARAHSCHIIKVMHTVCSILPNLIFSCNIFANSVCLLEQTCNRVISPHATRLSVMSCTYGPIQRGNDQIRIDGKAIFLVQMDVYVESIASQLHPNSKCNKSID